MARLPSLPDRPHLAEVFKTFPATVAPLLEYHDVLLRGPSPLSVAERELIAAYVSGLNACRFCFGAHKIMARAFDVEEAVIDDLMRDPNGAAIDDKLKPILGYVRKLTETPSRMTDADARAVYDTGWDEGALFDAVSVCALFNMMNRMIEGCGVTFDYAEAPPSAAEVAARRDRSYLDWGRQIGAVTDR